MPKSWTNFAGSTATPSISSAVVQKVSAHHIILSSLPSLWQKISHLVEIGTESWQKQLCLVFGGTRCTLSMMYVCSCSNQLVESTRSWQMCPQLLIVQLNRYEWSCSVAVVCHWNMNAVIVVLIAVSSKYFFPLLLLLLLYREFT